MITHRPLGSHPDCEEEGRSARKLAGFRLTSMLIGITLSVMLKNSVYLSAVIGLLAISELTRSNNIFTRAFFALISILIFLSVFHEFGLVSNYIVSGLNIYSIPLFSAIFIVGLIGMVREIKIQKIKKAQ